MDHHLLAVGSVCDANGRHQCTARTEAITRSPQVYVTRGEAQRAMVAVPPARDGCANEGAAAAALERLALVGAGVRAKRHLCPLSARSWSHSVRSHLFPI